MKSAETPIANLRNKWVHIRTQAPVICGVPHLPSSSRYGVKKHKPRVGMPAARAAEGQCVALFAVGAAELEELNGNGK